MPQEEENSSLLTKMLIWKGSDRVRLSHLIDYTKTTTE